MNYPLLDKRDKKQIKKQILELAPNYVPEWNFVEDNQDFGDALVDVFCSMYSSTVDRFNMLQFINYVHFLNKMRVKLEPGSSAEGNVTVVLNKGTTQGVYIRKGTQLYYDSGGETGQVLFETLHDCYAMDNHINHIFCVNSYNNCITQPWSDQAAVHTHVETSGKAIRLFDEFRYPNIQKHAFVFANADVMFIDQGASIELELRHSQRQLQTTEMAQFLADNKLFMWSIITETGFHKIEEVKAHGSRISLIIKDKIPLVDYMGKKASWISCQHLKTELLPNILVENLRIAGHAEALQPELLINNDMELTNYNFLPFGEYFASYDDFYIACKEAFTKRGALIELEFHMSFKRFLPPNPLDDGGIDWKLVMKESQLQEKDPLDIIISEVVWEYWNGNGWARLLFDDQLERMFSGERQETHKVVLKFLCPEDTASGYVGAHENYWLRARVRKVENAWKNNVLYLCPLVESLVINWNYRAETRALDHVYLERDLETKFVDFNSVQKEVELISKQKPEQLATYICLENSLQSGVLTMWFTMNKQLDKAVLPMRWEYYGMENGRASWIELKVFDGTNLLSQSGLVMMTGKNNCLKHTLYGVEGFWMRLVCQFDDNLLAKLQTLDLPEIKGIYFNTINVKQQETMACEYFSIEPHEAHKICDLVGDNIIEAAVWVDEYARISEQEWKILLESKNYQTKEEHNDSGQIQRRWVCWQEVEDIVLVNGNKRCYMLDAYNGKIIFGDDRNGRIPPAGSWESIKVIYKTGKSEAGNMKKEQLEAFADAVPFVKRVSNIRPLLGGNDRESTEDVLQKAPTYFSNRGATVTIEDYVQLIQQADKNIVKARCMAHTDASGQKLHGALTVAVLPRFYNSENDYFLKIRERVMTLLNQHAPGIMSHSGKLYVIETTYLEISLEVKLTVANYNDYHDVLRSTEANLRKFIDPVQGNFHGKGWEIGEFPNRERIYHIIKQQDRIQRVESINLTAQLITRTGRTPADLSDLESFPLSVPIVGDLNIDIEVG